MTSTEASAPRSLSAPTEPWTVHLSDARQTERLLSRIASENGTPESPFVTTTITSPPYANLVDYGTPNQVGFGQTFDSYLDECEAIFESVFKWTLDDGSLWIVADTMMTKPGRNEVSTLVPLPFALSERAARSGWILRDVIVWRKDRTRPWASPGRLRNGFEYVLYFVKGPRFKHHVDRLRDLRGLKSWWVKYPERHNPWGMTPDNVWEIPIPVQGSWASNELRHACPFPEELVRRMVELSSDVGDVVFDPFAGSGMVPAVSESLGRLPLGSEINPDFCRVYSEWVRPTVLAREPKPLDVDTLDITATLLALRVLKFPKVLLSQVMRAGVSRTDLVGAIVNVEPLDLSPKLSPYAALGCLLVVRDDVEDETLHSLLETANRALAQPPLSTWGVEPTVSVTRLQDVGDAIADSGPMAAYIAGRTWHSSFSVEADQVEGFLRETAARGVPPILSAISLSVELEA